VDPADMGDDLERVLLSEEQLHRRLDEIAAQIDADYEGKDLLLVGVLKGAVMVMADLARRLHSSVQMDWMAVSSYGSGTKSSGVVRILKDLDADLTGRHVLIVEDIIDSGLTLSWLLSNLRSRGPATVEIATSCASPRRPRSRSTSATWVSTSRTSSSSATASTTPRGIATCRSSGRSPRTCTAPDRRIPGCALGEHGPDPSGTPCNFEATSPASGG